MRTKEIGQEQISALADGELSCAEARGALDVLQEEKARADWELYHRIGEVLRSDDTGAQLSSGFAARMAARLEQEPVHAGAAHPVEESAQQEPPTPFRPQVATRPRLSRLTLSGMAAAAGAAAALLAGPRLMVAVGNTPDVVPPVASAAAVTPSAPAGATATLVAAKAPEAAVLRDPRIDEYLLAHQRFSPSVYSTAQYARSVTFPSDSGK